MATSCKDSFNSILKMDQSSLLIRHYYPTIKITSAFEIVRLYNQQNLETPFKNPRLKIDKANNTYLYSQSNLINFERKYKELTST